MSREKITNSIYKNIPPEQIDVEDPATVLPGRKNLRVSVSPRCNLQCLHCHNEGQPPPWAERAMLGRYEATVDSIGQLVAVASRFGVKSVKLTGGDPGIYNHLETLLTTLASEWQYRMNGIK